MFIARQCRISGRYRSLNSSWVGGHKGGLWQDMLHLGYGMTCYMRDLTGEGRIER